MGVTTGSNDRHNVYYSPKAYGAAAEAEAGLQIGSANPSGATSFKPGRQPEAASGMPSYG
jgi:hypothetical protein